MEGQVWSIVECILSDAQPASGRFQYGMRDILRVIIWAVLHDRPMVWACYPQNWPDTLRPDRLPHASTISRRWRTSAIRREADRLYRQTVYALGRVSRYAAIDGRPLLVGGYSKDHDARAGRAVGGMGRGYKLHAVVDNRHVILSYEIHTLSKAEPTVAVKLLAKIPKGVTRIVGDTIYDSMNLHRTAEQEGRKLYTPIRENRVGRRQQPRRLQLLRLNQRSVGKRLLAWRITIERTFGQTSTIGFGFKGLPPWARRIHRVERWMWAKLICHHAWIMYKKKAA